eukprot:jgi/Hompol1/6192/HPOL_004869-RA
MRPFLIGVGGASCSGKSSLTNWLAVIFDAAVIHQDKFYKSDSDIPLLNGVANWDCPEAIDTPAFVELLRHAKSPSNTEQQFEGALGDNRPQLSNDQVLPEVLEKLKSQAKAALAVAGRSIILVDGFLLYENPLVFGEFDAGFFLQASFETLLQRRNARERYVTLEEGYWEDPPN